MKILVVAEHNNQSFRPVNLHTLSAAKCLAELHGEIVETDILLAGQLSSELSRAAGQFTTVNTVICADHAVYQHQLPENLALLIAQLAADYDYILMGATTTGKNILPRVAALLNVAMLSDVMEIISPDTFVRPIYAGNALATCRLDEKIRLLTVRATAFPPLAAEKSCSAVCRSLETVIENSLTQYVTETHTESKRPELTDARVVISGGRGLKSAENFQLLEEIADQLGGAIGASRAAVDAGFAPNDWQVGQTGKIVAPDLYIAVGISGAIQHLAGMKDSKVVVAINQDEAAPIVAAADYVLTGDLFKILPEFKAALLQEG